MDGWGSIPDRGRNFFLFATTSRTPLGPTQPHIQWIPGAFYPEIKRQGREANHSPPSSAEINKVWCYIPPLPQYVIRGVVLCIFNEIQVSEFYWGVQNTNEEALCVLPSTLGGPTPGKFVRPRDCSTQVAIALITDRRGPWEQKDSLIKWLLVRN
jgi:hypothetical protein